MQESFQKKSKKRAKYLKIWAKMYKIWKKKKNWKKQPHGCDCCMHGTARISPELGACGGIKPGLQIYYMRDFSNEFVLWIVRNFWEHFLCRRIEHLPLGNTASESAHGKIALK